MAKKRYRPEEIIGKLREADVLIRQGKKAVSDLTLDKMILKEAARGNF